MMNSLPNELLLKIFHYSKGKDLLTFSSVCRRWHDLISSPSSTSDHHPSHALWHEKLGEDFPLLFTGNNERNGSNSNSNSNSNNSSNNDDGYPWDKYKFMYQNVILKGYDHKLYLRIAKSWQNIIAFLQRNLSAREIADWVRINPGLSLDAMSNHIKNTSIVNKKHCNNYCEDYILSHLLFDGQDHVTGRSVPVGLLGYYEVYDHEVNMILKPTTTPIAIKLKGFNLSVVLIASSTRRQVEVSYYQVLYYDGSDPSLKRGQIIIFSNDMNPVVLFDSFVGLLESFGDNYQKNNFVFVRPPSQPFLSDSLIVNTCTNTRPYISRWCENNPVATQTTRGVTIKVCVIPLYETSLNHRLSTAYQILISLDASLPPQTSVKLLAREWHVISTNEDGDIEENLVTGNGVIGFTPILKPGSEFIYASQSVTETIADGDMFGRFLMENLATKEQFHALIPRFPLKGLPPIIHS